MRDSLKQSIEILRKKTNEEFKEKLTQCNGDARIEAFNKNKAENLLMDTILGFSDCEQILPAIILLDFLTLIHFKANDVITNLGKAIQLVFTGQLTFPEDGMVNKTKLN